MLFFSDNHGNQWLARDVPNGHEDVFLASKLGNFPLKNGAIGGRAMGLPHSFVPKTRLNGRPSVIQLSS